MQSLKNIVINGAMILALLFGLMVSATAAPSFEEVKASAESGNAIAQVLLGDYYRDGKGVRQDYGKALEWHQKAAKQNHPHGQASLGYAYLLGKGVRQDNSKALEWFKKAAKQNNAHGQVGVGMMYEYGQGVRQNKTIAKEWYGKSCDNGYQGGCDSYKILNEQGY